MSRQLITAILLTCGLAALIAGCSEDCPTCPTETKVEPYRGWLYYVDANLEFYDLYVIDMESDSIVDSIDVPGRATGGMDVSADGRYLAVVAEEEALPDDDSLVVHLHTYVYDAQTREFIRELPYDVAPYFDVKHNRMIGMGRYLSGSYFSVHAYPSLELISVDTVDGVHGRTLDADRNLIYADGLGGTPYRYRFFAYDLTNHQLRKIPIIEADGDSVQVFEHCLNRAGTRLYFKGMTKPIEEFPFLACFDLVGNNLVWEYRTIGGWGGVTLSGDETEVWMTDPGIMPDGFEPGTVYIVDSQSGGYLQGISLWGYHPNAFRPLSGAKMIFSPAADKVYLGTGTYAPRGTGSVLVAGRTTRDILKVISPDLDRAVMNMRIGPKLE